MLGIFFHLPSDWVPRAFLRTQNYNMDWLVYCILNRSWRLLVRAKTCGVGRQVALYKKGNTTSTRVGGISS